MQRVQRVQEILRGLYHIGACVLLCYIWLLFLPMLLLYWLVRPWIKNL